jgi:hypothetical protein
MSQGAPVRAAPPARTALQRGGMRIRAAMGRWPEMI